MHTDLGSGTFECQRDLVQRHLLHTAKEKIVPIQEVKKLVGSDANMSDFRALKNLCFCTFHVLFCFEAVYSQYNHVPLFYF